MRILESIERKPLHCSGVAKAVGLDAWKTHEWLVTLVEDGDVIQFSNGAYELAHGGLYGRSGMKGLGEGVAFAVLCACATWLEVSGKPSGALWALVVMWAICTDWGQE